ncbi:glycoside hydrolase family 72 protein [Laccaria bicolor S238N-H82]|uniref:1,3-beta-glucanosyltransferase n=1 Tax=Laccaria bicolor (strain S238N-H82 / ATCC MYA-4686) TaxID=486041 RepID=B0DUR8_LACBS|nr:glycoside hydrolase family 72 protein [Laccaria bicolor S238N-H82]EDR01592.1 glycoside hydrolase family 72 protein [Laccaria bicolor S238N-H82]|eukprot:XP_001887668.1 glycoside hydrolase family 72 protein [Laccaria bicolor S238N-H82]
MITFQVESFKIQTRKCSSGDTFCSHSSLLAPNPHFFPQHEVVRGSCPHFLVLIPSWRTTWTLFYKSLAQADPSIQRGRIKVLYQACSVPTTSSPVWSTYLLDQYLVTIDAYSKYDNVLAFNSTSETGSSTAHPTHQRRSFRKSSFLRPQAQGLAVIHSVLFLRVPLTFSPISTAKKSNFLIGYAAIDGADNFPDWVIPQTPTLGQPGSTGIDLCNLNNYEWCGNSTFAGSYPDTKNNFAGYNVAAYFSEYGCVPPRCPPLVRSGRPFLIQRVSRLVWGIAFSYFSSSQRRRSIRHNHIVI